MQKSISVDADLCCHCGCCVQDCVVEALTLNEAELPVYVEGGAKLCVACQHCLAVCPTGALSFAGKKPQDSFPVGSPKSEDLLRLIQSRRSVRFYKKENVGEETISKLTSMLPYIPTGGNADNLYFSLVATREKMDAIRKMTYEKIANATNPSPVFKIAHQAFLAGKDVIYRSAPAMIAVAIDKNKTIPGCETADPIIALSYFELYAQSLGLGTLWCDYALMMAREIPEVLALLKIPANYTLDYIMLFGLPDVRYQRTIQPEMFTVHVLK